MEGEGIMKSEISNAKVADILIQALPYIRKYNGRIVVVKYGGNAMESPVIQEQVMKDIVLMTAIGIKVVVVHGGGLDIADALKKMGIETRFINGKRVTDTETMDVVQGVLAGKVNKNLVKMLHAAGGRAVGICGIDGPTLVAQPMAQEMGEVGHITYVNTKQITDLLADGYIPVISSVASDGKERSFNVNADTAAASIAGALKAEAMVAMTNIDGVMRDPNDRASLIHKISVDEAASLQEQGVIEGGMIPKVECCIDAISAGVKKVFIINGTMPHSILVEFLTDEGSGTMFIP